MQMDATLKEKIREVTPILLSFMGSPEVQTALIERDLCFDHAAVLDVLVDAHQG